MDLIKETIQDLFFLLAAILFVVSILGLGAGVFLALQGNSEGLTMFFTSLTTAFLSLLTVNYIKRAIGG